MTGKKPRFWYNEEGKTAYHTKGMKKIDTFFQKTPQNQQLAQPNLPPSPQSGLQSTTLPSSMPPIKQELQKSKNRKSAQKRKRNNNKEPSPTVSISFNWHQIEKRYPLDDNNNNLPNKKLAIIDLTNECNDFENEALSSGQLRQIAPSFQLNNNNNNINVPSHFFIEEEIFHADPPLSTPNTQQHTDNISQRSTQDSQEAFDDIEDSLNVNTRQQLSHLKRLSVFTHVDTASQTEQENLLTWFERVVNRLKLSSDLTEPTFDKNHPLKSLASQWRVTGVCNDLGSADGECELCSKEEIRYEFEIQHPSNKTTLILGSSCIKNITKSGALYQEPGQEEAFNHEDSINKVNLMVEDIQNDANEFVKTVQRYFLK